MLVELLFDTDFTYIHTILLSSSSTATTKVIKEWTGQTTTHVRELA